MARSRKPSTHGARAARQLQELADIAIYRPRLAEMTGVDLQDAIEAEARREQGTHLPAPAQWHFGEGQLPAVIS